MSRVVLLYVIDNHIHFLSSHYREILEQINTGKIVGDGFWLDAGYILVDCDSATIINNQNAFSASDIKNPVLKRFSLIHL
jgi:hypothetical protein